METECEAARGLLYRFGQMVDEGADDAELTKASAIGARSAVRRTARAHWRTGALAHGLADIWLTKLDRGHWAGARDGANHGCRSLREVRHTDSLARETPSQ
jgi:hypothetical protein